MAVSLQELKFTISDLPPRVHRLHYVQENLKLFREIHPIKVDPTANGNIFRYTFGIQTLLNVFGGGHMILFAEHSLSQLVSEPSDMNPAALATMQQCGALMFAFNTPPVLAIPNIRRAIDSRGSVYYLLDSGEICMMSFGPVSGIQIRGQ